MAGESAEVRRHGNVAQRHVLFLVDNRGYVGDYSYIILSDYA